MRGSVDGSGAEGGAAAVADAVGAASAEEATTGAAEAAGGGFTSSDFASSALVVTVGVERASVQPVKTHDSTTSQELEGMGRGGKWSGRTMKANDDTVLIELRV